MKHRRKFPRIRKTSENFANLISACRKTKFANFIITCNFALKVATNMRYFCCGTSVRLISNEIFYWLMQNLLFSQQNKSRKMLHKKYLLNLSSSLGLMGAISRWFLWCETIWLQAIKTGSAECIFCHVARLSKQSKLRYSQKLQIYFKTVAYLLYLVPWYIECLYFWLT